MTNFHFISLGNFFRSFNAGLHLSSKLLITCILSLDQTLILQLLQKFLCIHWLIFIINNRADTKIYNFCCKKQIDISFSCRCPVIDNEFCHNIGYCLVDPQLFWQCYDGIMINNRTDAWKTDLNLLNMYVSWYFVVISIHMKHQQTFLCIL